MEPPDAVDFVGEAEEYDQSIAPQTFDEFLFGDSSTIYLHEGQYYITTGAQTVEPDVGSSNAELVLDDSMETVDEDTTCNNDPLIVYTLDESLMDSEAKNEDEEQELCVDFDDEEPIAYQDQITTDTVVGKNLVTGDVVTLQKYLQEVNLPKKISKKGSNGATRKSMIARIVHIKDKQCENLIEEDELCSEYKELVSKTLISMMEEDSINSRLMGSPLFVKVTDCSDGSLRYMNGFMKQTEAGEWTFIDFANKENTEQINEAKIKFRYKDHVSITASFTKQSGKLETNKFFLSLVPKKYVCIVCYKELMSVSKLENHYMSHPDFRQSCGICGKPSIFLPTFAVWKQVFSDSWDDKDTENQLSTCNSCAQSFLFLRDLNEQSEEYLRPTSHNYKCSVCGRTFSRRGNMLRHAAIHNNGGHKCTMCGIFYQHASSLTRHIVQCHVSTSL